MHAWSWTLQIAMLSGVADAMEVRAHRVQTVLTQMTRQHEHVSIAHVNAFLSTVVCWRAHENARAHGVNLVHVLITASACVRA